MKKTVVFTMFFLSIYSINGLSLERPPTNSSLLNKYNSYLEDVKIDAFICTNGLQSYIISKKSLGVAYTSENYYVLNNSTGIAFEIQKCKPARFDR